MADKTSLTAAKTRFILDEWCKELKYVLNLNSVEICFSEPKYDCVKARISNRKKPYYLLYFKWTFSRYNIPQLVIWHNGMNSIVDTEDYLHKILKKQTDWLITQIED